MLSTIVKIQTYLANRNDEGATAVEYGLLVALIAAVIMVTVALIGGNLDRIFGLVNTKLTSVT